MEETVPSPRTPEEDDLVKLCAALNDRGALYIVVGGIAVNQQGFLRATEDIDLLLESSKSNQESVLRALEVLPDKAVLEVNEGDLDEFTVVRVADEVVVDLMLSTCGIVYDEAKAEIEAKEIRGVSIPFASAKLLLRMKQTYREKDIADRLFLEEKLRSEFAK
jgi:PleD family two-component response regulator